MGLRSVRVGRLAGIPIGVQPLWFVIVGLITWSLGAVYYPDQAPGIAPAAAYGLGLLSALLLLPASSCTSSGTRSSRVAMASRSKRSTSGCWGAWPG
jgi:hypothetical protein